MYSKNWKEGILWILMKYLNFFLELYIAKQVQTNRKVMSILTQKIQKKPMMIWKPENLSRNQVPSFSKTLLFTKYWKIPYHHTVATFPPPEPHTKLEEDPEYEEEDDEYEEYDYSTDKSLEPKSGKAKDDMKPKSDKIIATVSTNEEAIVNRNSNGNGSSSRIYSQQTPTQKQTAIVANSNEKHRIVQTQNGRTVHFPTTTEKNSDGFNKIVQSKEVIDENSKLQKNTKSKYLPKNLSRNNDLKSNHPPDSYVTVTKSISGSLDDNKLPNVESTYYTKSSTCGYFTFSCNIVYGSNGRSKICRPKAPSNGKC
jgi:hypothetical protein